MRKKSLGITNSEEAKNIGVVHFGDPNAWKLISKAYHEDEGWMKSTSAMEIPGVGCLVKVSVHQLSKGGDYQSVSEALTAIPGVAIDTITKDGKIVERRLLSAEMIARAEPIVGPGEPLAVEETSGPIETFADASEAVAGAEPIDETDAEQTDEAAQQQDETADIDGMGPLATGQQETLE